MIVFYLCIGILLIFLIIIFSSITVELKKMEIKNIEDLKKIYLAIDRKKYDKMFNYIELEIKIKINILGVFPIFFIKINSKSAQKLLYKIMEKDKKEKQKNPTKFKIKREKQKRQLKRLRKKINTSITIKDADLTLSIGLTNAGVTAIATGFLNALFSMILLDYISEMIEIDNSKKSNQKLSKIVKNLNYVVQPIYSNEFAFNLMSNIKLKFPIHALI